jgi:ribA/ribD-fused uncharacterized protein
MKTIRFYRVEDSYGEFSNFAPTPIALKGKTWPTSEHYFQAQKFAGHPDEETIRQAESPAEAARMGRERTRPLRADWETVKESVMHQALYAKFTQHEALKAKLLDTGDALLIEHTKNDTYWADGGDGSGKNRLGVLLMDLREQLRQEVNPAPCPTLQEIDTLVAFLPQLYAEGFTLIDRWGGGTKQPDGAITMPWPEYAPVVTQFFAAASQPCWCDYDYRPDEAARMLQDANGIANASLAQIKTLLTYCVRGERFCDGHWAAMIEQGHIRRLLQRLMDFKKIIG